MSWGPVFFWEMGMVCIKCKLSIMISKSASARCKMTWVLSSWPFEHLNYFIYVVRLETTLQNTWNNVCIYMHSNLVISSRAIMTEFVLTWLRGQRCKLWPTFPSIRTHNPIMNAWTVSLDSWTWSKNVHAPEVLVRSYFRWEHLRSCTCSDSLKGSSTVR